MDLPPIAVSKRAIIKIVAAARSRNTPPALDWTLFDIRSLSGTYLAVIPADIVNLVQMYLNRWFKLPLRLDRSIPACYTLRNLGRGAIKCYGMDVFSVCANSGTVKSIENGIPHLPHNHDYICIDSGSSREFMGKQYAAGSHYDHGDRQLLFRKIMRFTKGGLVDTGKHLREYDGEISVSKGFVLVQTPTLYLVARIKKDGDLVFMICKSATIHDTYAIILPRMDDARVSFLLAGDSQIHESSVQSDFSYADKWMIQCGINIHLWIW